jgi:poly(A) polymerase/tRNA nucleotidyltransferase (CCA-adding enzyme)
MALPEWQREILDRGELYRVGGAVRDRLLDASARPPDDDFLVRGLPPEELETLLGRYGRVVLVGKSFGVYRFTPGNGDAVDIVYPRRERSTGPGHRDFDVHWDWRMPVEEDLVRRDFTVNAIAEDVRTGRRIDPAGGQADLSAGILRAMFPAAFIEDPLRVLRGIRFAATLHFRVEPDTRRMMAQAAPALGTLSAQRVQEEFTKILTRCEQPSAAFVLAHEIGALAVVLPELDRCVGVEQNEYHPDDVFVHSLKTLDCAPRDNLTVRWAALMHDVGKVDTRERVDDERGERIVFYGHEKVSARLTRRALERLRYPVAMVERCVHLVRQHMFNYLEEWKDATVRRFMRTVGDHNLEDLFALREADCRSRNLYVEIDNLRALEARVAEQRAARHTLAVEDLAVDGRDVMEVTGLAPGRAVGEILERLLERVLDDPSMNDRDRLRKAMRGMRTGEGE